MNNIEEKLLGPTIYQPSPSAEENIRQIQNNRYPFGYTSNEPYTNVHSILPPRRLDKKRKDRGEDLPFTQSEKQDKLNLRLQATQAITAAALADEADAVLAADAAKKARLDVEASLGTDTPDFCTLAKSICILLDYSKTFNGPHGSKRALLWQQAKYAIAALLTSPSSQLTKHPSSAHTPNHLYNNPPHDPNTTRLLSQRVRPVHTFYNQQQHYLQQLQQQQSLPSPTTNDSTSDEDLVQQKPPHSSSTISLPHPFSSHQKHRNNIPLRNHQRQSFDDSSSSPPRRRQDTIII
mmetsp:Transcript_17343/g.21078  ORF Transcript_17343/g.21078 Transcript_17343/m.21078 type:complete len:293 (+) Transcript_17343:83-961(+)